MFYDFDFICRRLMGLTRRRVRGRRAIVSSTRIILLLSATRRRDFASIMPMPDVIHRLKARRHFRAAALKISTAADYFVRMPHRPPLYGYDAHAPPMARRRRFLISHDDCWRARHDSPRSRKCLYRLSRRRIKAATPNDAGAYCPLACGPFARFLDRRAAFS